MNFNSLYLFIVPNICLLDVICNKCCGLFSPNYINGSCHHLKSVTTENALLFSVVRKGQWQHSLFNKVTKASGITKYRRIYFITFLTTNAINILFWCATILPAQSIKLINNSTHANDVAHIKELCIVPLIIPKTIMIPVVCYY